MHNNDILRTKKVGDVSVPANFANEYWFWTNRILEDIQPIFVPFNVLISNFVDEIFVYVYA